MLHCRCCFYIYVYIYIIHFDFYLFIYSFIYKKSEIKAQFGPSLKLDKPRSDPDCYDLSLLLDINYFQSAAFEDIFLGFTIKSKFNLQFYCKTTIKNKTKQNTGALL